MSAKSSPHCRGSHRNRASRGSFLISDHDDLRWLSITVNNNLLAFTQVVVVSQSEKSVFPINLLCVWLYLVHFVFMSDDRICGARPKSLMRILFFVADTMQLADDLDCVTVEKAS